MPSSTSSPDSRLVSCSQLGGVRAGFPVPSPRDDTLRNILPTKKRAPYSGSFWQKDRYTRWASRADIFNVTYTSWMAACRAWRGEQRCSWTHTACQ